MIALLVIFNFAVSILNAWFTGRSWVETKAVGGWVRFMSWMGATMSAVGFSWCYLVILAVLAGPEGFNKLPAPYVKAMFSLGYLALIIPCIGSGLAITIDTWIYFWKKRSIGSGILAGYNTFADIYNMYEAFQNVPSAWGDVSSILFGGKSKSKSDKDNDLSTIAIAMAIMALLGGVLTTAAIIRTVAEKNARNMLWKRELNRS